MLGAIIGDLAGSIYEFDQIKNTHPVIIDNIIENNAFFSDDTILTVAILDAIVSKIDYGQKLKEYGKKYEKYMPDSKPYFATIFRQDLVNGLMVIMLVIVWVMGQ